MSDNVPNNYYEKYGSNKNQGNKSSSVKYDDSKKRADVSTKPGTNKMSYREANLQSKTQGSISNVASSVKSNFITNTTSTTQEGDSTDIMNVVSTVNVNKNFDFEVSDKTLRDAIIWSEILGKPVSKRRKRRYYGN